MIRQVLRQAASAADDHDERLALHARIRDRLNAIEADPPAAEIITSVCTSLGLTLDRARLPEDLFYLLRNEAPQLLRATSGPGPP